MTASRSAQSPLDLNVARARASILQAAIGLFTRRNFADTRVEDLLEAAKVARRTFYKHFNNKEEVLAAIFEFAGAELLRALETDLASDANPLDRLRRTLDVYFDYHLANPRLLGTLLQHALDPRSPIAEQRRRFRAQLTTLMDDAVHAATGQRHDPMLYGALLSALEGTSLDLEGADKKQVARARKTMHVLLDRALGAAG